MEKQENRLKLIKMKGYRGYVQHGFKKLADKYHTVKWGNGVAPKKTIKGSFKTTYVF